MPRKSIFSPKGDNNNDIPIAMSITSLTRGRDNLGYEPDVSIRHLQNVTTTFANNTNDIGGGKRNQRSHPSATQDGLSIIYDSNIVLRRQPFFKNGQTPNSFYNGIADPTALTSDSNVLEENGTPHKSTNQGRSPTARESANGEDRPVGGVSPPPKSDGVAMKKSINLLQMIAILVSVTGHSSIFIAPSSILTQTGSVGGALIVWFVGGLIHLGTALCFAELGTMFPGAGGPYAYAMKAFGPLAGFLMMWIHIILIAGPFWAFLARTAIVYILRPVFPGCNSPELETAITLLAGWLIISFTVLNCVYMKYVTKVQTLLTSTKLIVLLIIIAAGIYYIVQGNTEHLQNPFENTATEPGQFALGVFYATFGYGGWQVMTTMLAEVKDPARDPPRAVFISFTIVIILYLMANVSYMTLLTPEQVKQSTAVASDFIGEISDVLLIVVSVLVALTSIGALNASIMGHSRLFFAGAQNGHMPQILGMIQTKYLTPWPSIFAYMAWSLVMLYTGGVVDMMDYISLASTIMSLVVVSALLYFRWKQPNLDRPYKSLLIVPILLVIINLAMLVLGIYQKPHKMGKGLAIFFAGIPAYWLGVLWKDKPKEFTDMVDDITAFTQKLFLLTKVAQ